MPSSLSPITASQASSRFLSLPKPYLFLWIKRLFALFFSVIFLVLVIILGFNGYIAWALGRPAPEPLHSNPLEAAGLAYEDVQFHDLSQQTVLSGWYIPSVSGTSRKTIIFSHGYMGNREEKWVPLYTLSKEMHMRNYNVLLFDYGYVSTQHPMTGGAQESKELLGAIRYIKGKADGQIIIWGFSMGAGTALQAALDNTDISAMILDSTFLLDPQSLKYSLRRFQERFPITPEPWLVEFFLPLLGSGIDQIPHEEVKTASYTMPILLIHGTRDTLARFDLAQQIFANQSANEQSQIWLAPKRGHETIFRKQPKEYLERSIGFLQGL